MDKYDLLRFFQVVSPCIKFNHYLKLVKIDNGAFSRFMKGKLNAIALVDLLILYDLIIEDMTLKLSLYKKVA